MSNCRLTAEGRAKAAEYIEELKKERKELLAAGKDTADKTPIPTVEDIEKEIPYFPKKKVSRAELEAVFRVDWPVSDNFHSSRSLILEEDTDFVRIEDPVKRITYSQKFEIGTRVKHANFLMATTETGNKEKGVYPAIRIYINNDRNPDNLVAAIEYQEDEKQFKAYFYGGKVDDIIDTFTQPESMFPALNDEEED